MHGILSPFEPGSRILPAGFQLAPQFRPLTCDILFENDVPIVLRDGVTIYTDLFRPVGSDKVPALIAWSPYGKSGGSAPKTTGLYATLGIDNALLSGGLRAGCRSLACGALPGPAAPGAPGCAR